MKRALEEWKELLTNRYTYIGFMIGVIFMMFLMFLITSSS